MCGIAGIFGEKSRDPRVISAMANALVHRGPDDCGAWADMDAGVAFGHRRLAVVDLSLAGHQPMESADGRFVLTFNGEIYNFAEVRDELEARGEAPTGGWRGHSDTEVFLQSVAAWGLEKALAKAIGMFAFGLWDRKDRLLTLVRDRFGEKPLYYGWAGKDFVFGSELKALRAHPGFDAAISRRALGLFLSRNHVPTPLSIYEGAFKLSPGCMLEVTAEGALSRLSEPLPEGGSGKIRLRRYWSYKHVVRRGLADSIQDESEALEAVEGALAASVEGQSIADVPVGTFLSGGIDSSLVTALYQRHSRVPVRTFSIGFEDAAFNEAEHAKAVALHLGTVHHELYVTADEARRVIPLLPAMYDEPFADSSQIPTYLVSRFARQEVTVALTGDGGDELFGGYNRHLIAPRLWKHLQRLPRSVRAMAGSPLKRIPSQFWNGAAGVLAGRRQPQIGMKVQKALGVAASADSIDDIYRSLLDEWHGWPSPLVEADPAGLPPDFDAIGDASDAVRMMYCDAVSYLPDDILCKVDRASMAVSLETRVPFLNRRVAEVAARIPLSMKIREGRGKVILRRLLDKYVPAHLVDRPKAGFAVPVGDWIRGPLRGWAEDMLDPRSLRLDGLFDPDVIASRWRDHRNGSRDSSDALWSVLMFQAWLREQRRATAVAA